MRLIFVIAFIALTSCNSNIETVERFSNGKPSKTIEHLDKDSTCKKSYYENGNLKEVTFFHKGQQSGQQIFYRQDGTKSAVMYFENGKRNGKTYEFYPSGEIGFEGNSVDGKFEGLSKWYFKNGKVNWMGNRHLDKDTGWWYYFNVQGDTVKRTYNKSINDTSKYFDGAGKKITAEEWDKIRTE